MTRTEFLQQRRPVWHEFEALVERKQRLGARRLTADDVQQFSRILRELGQDLAVIQSRDWGPSLASYVNNLALRGHNALYAAPPTRGSAIFEFLAVGFPRLFRRELAYIGVSALLFCGPMGVTWALVQSNPGYAQRIYPPEMLEGYDQMYARPDEGAEALDEEHAGDEGASSSDPYDPSFGEQRAAMAGFYVQHNVGIALQCFARGLLLGIGTVYTLIYNGIAIGGVAGYLLARGHGESFLSFVVSHGAFELTAIVIAGGAGLMLGDALLHPRGLSRSDSLRRRGLDAVKIAGGAAVMLFVAALIEAFWSPADIDANIKYAAGATLWTCVGLYLFLSGRDA